MKILNLLAFSVVCLLGPQSGMAQDDEKTRECLAQWIRDLNQPNLSPTIRAEREQSLRAREEFCFREAASRPCDQGSYYQPQQRSSSYQTEDRSQSYECRQALRNLDIAQSSTTNKSGIPSARATVNTACGAGATAGIDPPPRTSPPPHRPIILSSCDASGCWDTTGIRYNRAGGNNFFRQDGMACQAVAAGMLCR